MFTWRYLVLINKAKSNKELTEAINAICQNNRNEVAA